MNKVHLSNGTTIMGVKCTDGVVLAADSRATLGSFIAAREMNKIVEVTPNIFVMHSGSASSTQVLTGYAKYYLNAIKMNEVVDKKPSVKTVAMILKKLVQANKEYVSAQMIVGGVDEDGPQVYFVMQSGMALPRDYAAGGSGSTYLTTYIDQKFVPNMNIQQATDFAIKAVNLAIIRDGYSGGPINVVQIRDDGAKRTWVLPGEQPYGPSIVKS